MSELVKSILLMVLIFSSFLLSGLLWFSSPTFEDNQRSGYIKPPQIGHEKDKKNPFELIAPGQIIFHQKGKHHLLPASNDIYMPLLEKINLESIRVQPASPSEEEWSNIYDKSTSLELRFLNNIPLNLFPFLHKDELPNLNIDSISRIWFFEDKEEKVKAWLISDQEGIVIKSEVETNELDPFRAITADPHMLRVEPVFLPSGATEPPEDESLPQAIYLPQKASTVNQLTYKLKLIQVEDIKNWLFPDPALTRRLPYKHEFIYTDGSRNLTHDTKKETMIYRDLALRPTQASFPMEELTTLTQFMNKHSGWTGNFLLERLDTDENDQLHRYTFRLTVQGYPIYAEHEDGPDTIQLISTALRVTEYKRSLFYLSPQPEKTTSSQLPGKKEVLRSMERAGFSLGSIRDLFPGYQAISESDRITLRLTWFVVQADGKIQAIPSP